MRINILATIDRNYLAPLITMLVSMGQSDDYNELHIYVAHSSLEQEDFDKIQTAIDDYKNIIIHPTRVGDELFHDTPVIERLPKESFYRLLAFAYLPEEVERCIYLDPDTYILKPLDGLFSMEMNGNIIGASSHVYSFMTPLNQKRLNMGKKAEYINSGIMLMDIKEMREYRTVEEIITYVNDNIQKLYLGDQDAMNGLFWAKTFNIDEKLYNMDEKTLKRHKLNIDYVKENTVIVHYNGKYKPWNEGYKGELDVFYPPVENKGPAPKGKLKKQMKAFMNIAKLNKQQKVVLSLGAVVWACLLFTYFKFGGTMWEIVKDPVIFKQWLESFGGFDDLLYILIRAVQTVVKIVPAEPLEIGAGYAYGIFGGTLYCLLGNILGSIVILALTRKFGRKFVDIFYSSSKIDNMKIFRDQQKVYSLLFILYLIPGSPKDGFTYLVGLTPINSVAFLAITSVARIPSIISSTWCGYYLAEQNYIFAAIVFGVTLLVGILGGIIYNKIVNKKKEEADEKKVKV